MVSYVAVTMFLYRLILLYAGGRRLPAVAGALVFALNVNALYQQSTPMDELPFFAFTAAAVYYLVKWGETRSATNLLTGSAAAMLAALCRYEGWFLAVIYVACTVAMARRLGYSLWLPDVIGAHGCSRLYAVTGAAHRQPGCFTICWSSVTHSTSRATRLRPTRQQALSSESPPRQDSIAGRWRSRHTASRLALTSASP